ncbi:MAG: phosphate ABC transporter substrate-binding protein PstS [bacterium]|nr:phosphate ABC transporter substrate-binding protein PstS [bacterium]
MFLISVYANANSATILVGAGASFPNTVFNAWFDHYHQKTGVTVNYSAIGSGGGIRHISNKSVDFAATDAFLSDDELARIDGKISHIPVSVGGVVVAFNVPGIKTLKLSGATIARIFRGQIAHWNHIDIEAENPGIKLPKLPITPIHRSDSSGTTHIFTEYLSNSDKTWARKMGNGRSIKWFGGVRARGNSGMLAALKRTKGGIAYLELSHMQKKLGVVQVKNNSGHYIAPTVESISLAADVDFPEDGRLSLTDTTAEFGYPITGISWLLVYEDQSYSNRFKVRADATHKLITWLLSDEAQVMAPKLGYGKLPKSGIRISRKILSNVHYANQNLKQVEY